ncbi:hypothetical protein TKK_0003695 [Trichogramma kaykai]
MASNQENSTRGPILHLQSSDKVVFDVELAIAKRSMMIKAMIETLGEDNFDEVLPLPQIKSDILGKVIEFITHHKNDPMPNGNEKPEMTEWDEKFLKVDLDTLVGLMNAANFLDIKDLLEFVGEVIPRDHMGHLIGGYYQKRSRKSKSRLRR